MTIVWSRAVPHSNSKLDEVPEPNMDIGQFVQLGDFLWNPDDIFRLHPVVRDSLAGHSAKPLYAV